MKSAGRPASAVLAMIFCLISFAILIPNAIGGPLMEKAADTSLSVIAKAADSSQEQCAAHVLDLRLDRMIHKIADQHGVDAYLVKGLIKAESGFNPKAKSPGGACGLMQLMPGTARKMGAKNVFNPVQNLRAGIKYLSRLIDRFGGIHSALAAYIRGPQAVERNGGAPPDEFTREFIARILRYSRAYRKAGEMLSGKTGLSDSSGDDHSSRVAAKEPLNKSLHRQMFALPRCGERRFEPFVLRYRRANTFKQLPLRSCFDNLSTNGDASAQTEVVQRLIQTLPNDPRTAP